MMPDKWIGAFPALIADIALRAIPVKRRFEIFSKMLLNPDNIGTDFESVGAFDGYADRACFGRF